MECPICITTIDSKTEWKTACNHVFHENCFKDYIAYNKNKDSISCPSCRSVLWTKDEQPEPEGVNEHGDMTLRFQFEQGMDEMGNMMSSVCIAGALMFTFFIFILFISLFASKFSSHEQSLNY